MNKKFILLSSATLLLSACASPFQPLKGVFGYNVFSLGDGKYRIEYVDSDISSLHKHWDQAANMACSGEYTTRYSAERAVENGSYVVPIAGTNQTFAYYLQMMEGEVNCKNNAPTTMPLASSPWFFYGKQNERVPVSQSHLVIRFSLSPSFLSKAQKIKSTTSSTGLVVDLIF